MKLVELKLELGTIDVSKLIGANEETGLETPADE
jgi:hypothetical protein